MKISSPFHFNRTKQYKLLPAVIVRSNKKKTAQLVFEPFTDGTMEVDQGGFSKFKRKRNDIKENIDCDPPSIMNGVEPEGNKDYQK